MNPDDVVWRADTGAYHTRSGRFLSHTLPLMQASPPTPASERTAEPCRAACLLRSTVLTNLLLVSILVVLLLGGA